MPTYSSPVSLTAPTTDWGQQQSELQRRQIMAQRLMDQGQEPLGPTQSINGVAIPQSWTQGLAKVLQSGMGAYQQQKALDEQHDLSNRYGQAQGADAQALAAYLRGTPGTPEQPPMTPNDDNGNPNPPVSASPATAPMSGAMPSFQTPEYRQLLAQMMMKQAEHGMESPYAKVDPSKFTPESVAKFSVSRNPADLVAAASPDALLRNNTTLQTHATPSGSAILTNQGAMDRHATPSGSAQLGAQTTLTTHATPSGSALTSAETARRGQDIGATTARRGQDMAADPTIQGRLAEVRGAGRTTGTATAQAAMDLPAATAKAEQAIQLIDQMVGTAGAQGPAGKPHPGFQDVVGATWKPGARLVPGTNAAGFQALLDQVKGGAFMQAYETLRGGGQITEVEGTKATSAITRMDKAQSEKEFTAAAREFQGVIRAGVQRARQKAAGRRASDAPGAVIDFNSLPDN